MQPSIEIFLKNGVFKFCLHNANLESTSMDRFIDDFGE